MWVHELHETKLKGASARHCKEVSRLFGKAISLLTKDFCPFRAIINYDIPGNRALPCPIAIAPLVQKRQPESCPGFTSGRLKISPEGFHNNRNTAPLYPAMLFGAQRLPRYTSFRSLGRSQVLFVFVIARRYDEACLR